MSVYFTPVEFRYTNFILCDDVSYTNSNQVKNRECLHVRCSKRDWSVVFYNPKRYVPSNAIRKSSIVFCIMTIRDRKRIGETFLSKVHIPIVYRVTDYVSCLKTAQYNVVKNITIFRYV